MAATRVRKKRTYKTSVVDRTKQALSKINQFTADGVRDYSKDSAELARRLLQDNISSHSAKQPEARTGELAESIKAVKGDGELSWAVRTDAQNDNGNGYGAAQEYGWTAKNGTKMKGRFFIIRGTMGMLSRWRKGGRWNPEG